MSAKFIVVVYRAIRGQLSLQALSICRKKMANREIVVCFYKIYSDMTGDK